ncbi:synaptotagmin-8 [Budorcas taxicolor]|uniref:synaptotagmin-8 n=1 Tax=Budorcas taxicolor TaxID=37181 RepID=UPI002283A56F|nr:synaptotagmin-8 [Budorcas taxicolor]
MGHPPDTHSVRTPAGTTAAPGLTPDLTTPIPWLRWALVAAAVVAGILLASCLLCTVRCCHRGRRRKRPRDKEAVVPGTAELTTTTHLVQPELGNVASGPGGAQQWGRLQLSLEYNSGSQEIRVGLKQAADLRPRAPGGTADPYARLSLSPDAGRVHETKVRRGTLCPVFEETCSFHVLPAELPRTTLRVLLRDHRRLSQHRPMGVLSLPLGSVDLQHVLELWHPLGPPAAAEPEQTEELCFSLRYVPGSGRLTVVVLEARGLSPALADPYVKIQLMLNQRKWKRRKTSARKGTATPYFNEGFTFLVPFSQIQSVDLVLAVWARGPQLRAEPVGKVLLGARASGQPLQHWADMLAQARRPVAQWHRLQPAREVDQALALQGSPEPGPPRAHCPRARGNKRLPSTVCPS